MKGTMAPLGMGTLISFLIRDHTERDGVPSGESSLVGSTLSAWWRGLRE